MKSPNLKNFFKIQMKLSQMTRWSLLLQAAIVVVEAVGGHASDPLKVAVVIAGANHASVRVLRHAVLRPLLLQPLLSSDEASPEARLPKNRSSLISPRRFGCSSPRATRFKTCGKHIRVH